MPGFLSLAAAAPEAAEGLDGALRWLASPADPPLLMILGLCLAAALGGRLERRLLGGAASRQAHHR